VVRCTVGCTQSPAESPRKPSQAKPRVRDPLVIPEGSKATAAAVVRAGSHGVAQ
jgi:hypothetical protein